MRRPSRRAIVALALAAAVALPCGALAYDTLVPDDVGYDHPLRLADGNDVVPAVRWHRWRSPEPVVQTFRLGELERSEPIPRAAVFAHGDSIAPDLVLLELRDVPSDPDASLGDAPDRTDPHARDGSCLVSRTDGHVVLCETHEGVAVTRALVGDLYLEVLMPRPRRLVARRLGDASIAWTTTLDPALDPAPPPPDRDFANDEESWSRFVATSEDDLALVTPRSYVEMDARTGAATLASPAGATGVCEVDGVVVASDGQSLLVSTGHPVSFHVLVTPGSHRWGGCRAMVAGDTRVVAVGIFVGPGWPEASTYYLDTAGALLDPPPSSVTEPVEGEESLLRP